MSLYHLCIVYMFSDRPVEWFVSSRVRICNHVWIPGCSASAQINWKSNKKDVISAK